MTYALVRSNVIEAVGGLPRAARRLDTAEWVLGLRDAPVELQQACGYFAVVDTAKPADTPTTTHDRSVELVDGTPTVVWTERPKTADELKNEAREQKRTTVGNAVATLRQWADDAEATTATSGNAVAVLNTVVDRLGVFFDRFADLIEAQGIDQS